MTKVGKMANAGCKCGQLTCDSSNVIFVIADFVALSGVRGVRGIAVPGFVLGC
jgi:hypothetical protein